LLLPEPLLVQPSAALVLLALVPRL